MSLIHQALKKLESMRLAPNAAGHVVAKSRASHSTGKAPGILKPLIALAVVAIIGFVAYKTLPLKWKGIAQTAKPVPDVVDDASLPVRAEQAVAKDPVAEKNSNGLRFFSMGRHADAIREFKDAIAVSPKDSVLQNNIGAAYLLAGGLKDAEASFKTALSINKDYAQALNNYGALLVKKREHKKAIEFLRNALSLKNPYPEAHLNLAIARELGKEYESAIEHYNVFIETTADESMKDAAREKVKKLRYAAMTRGSAR